MGGPPNSLVHICLSSIKLKTLFHTFIFYRIGRAFAKAKSLLLDLLGEFSILKKNKKQKKKLFFGSFRLHYNWCTSHVMPANSHVYYDASWNTTTSLDIDHQMDGSDELSRYLEWLEEKKSSTLEETATATAGCNEIDELADLFIANCHEKFRLEKQESYRRFQEMIMHGSINL